MYFGLCLHWLNLKPKWKSIFFFDLLQFLSITSLCIHTICNVKQCLKESEDSVNKIILSCIPSFLGKHSDTLKQWFLKCGPWTSCISITWEFVRNSNSVTISNLLNHKSRVRKQSSWNSTSFLYWCVPKYKNNWESLI